MKYLSQRPDLICWGAIPVLVAIRGLLLGKYTLDIELYDTYYLTEYRVLSLIMGLIMLFYGAIYSFIRSGNVRVLPILTTWQLLLTVGGFLILILIFLFTGMKPGDMPRARYYNWTNFETENNPYSLIIWILVALTAEVVGFVLMIFNLVMGLIRRSKLA